MYFSKKEEGTDIIISRQINTDLLIDYQHQMINQSEQNIILKSKLINSLYTYNITSFIPIDIYFHTNDMSLELQKTIIIKMIDSLVCLEKYLLDIERVVLDKHFIYLDPNDLSIKFLYLPFSDYKISINKYSKDLFLSLFLSTDISYLSSNSKIKKIISILQSDDFDLISFRSILFSLNITNEKQRKNEKIKPKFLERFRKKKEETSYEEQNETVIASVEEKYPSLDFESKSVKINKESFLIGRSRKLSDYSMEEVLSLSRVHSQILKEDKKYFLIDINTKNGTFLNEMKLESQKKYRLRDGDKIKFATVKATFKMGCIE